LKSGNLKLLEPSGPVQACNGFAFFTPTCVDASASSSGCLYFHVAQVTKIIKIIKLNKFHFIILVIFVTLAKTEGEDFLKMMQMH